MKTNRIFLFLAMVAAYGLLQSCETESVSDSPFEEPQGQDAFSRSVAARGITTFDDMLAFPDVETFVKVIDDLELQTEEHDDKFLKEWGHLEGDELDDMEDKLGYNPDQVLIDFEKQFSGFSSLRKKLRAEEEKWLNNEELDDKNDPDEHYIFDDEVRTVVNELGNVKIGNLLYHFTRYGYVTVEKNDVALLNRIAVSNAEEFVDVDGVAIHGGYTGGSSSGNYNNNSGSTGGSNTPECRLGFQRSRYYYPTSRRRIKGKQKLSHPSGIWGSRIKSKTVHYKKRRGRWKRRRGTITAQIRGLSVNQYCAQEAELYKSKTRRRRSVKVKIKAPAMANFNYKTRQMQLRTVHKKVSTNSTYDHFFWEN